MYDFTTILDRHGKDALAVDGPQPESMGSMPAAPKEGFDMIPMWIADMNFATCPTIQEAIIERAKHPLFGYFDPTDEYYNAIIDWQRRRNGVEELTPDEIGYENGVLGCVNSVLQAFTAPGEKVLLHSPTYIGFTESLGQTGRVAEHSPLVKDEEGIWRMDFEDMDRRLKENKIHLAIFCSPHNPCGRVWEHWEIEKAMEVFAANDCVVISDEIWSDLMLNDSRHIPTQSVSEDARNRTIAVYAPSKTFNLAGLIGSYHIIYNPYLRHRVTKQSAAGGYNHMNVLSMHALIGAYRDEGHQWVDELKEVLSKNINYAHRFITDNFDGVEVCRPEGTYMMLIDCEKYCKRTGRSMDEILQAGWDVGVAYQDGRLFYAPWSIRMNFALPHSRVVEAMERLKKYVF
ncbi:MAG: aminotransferase class I/II-fold pyridoxal phosphate-dependent enzyme [Firmicutes bacterium]|nr:aminotransferase class I/II-fold pyridoxal phosphate-dependent enzyme [Bacillota bacterium]